MRNLTRRALYLGLLALYLLHNDLWLWNDATTVAGLPAGLAYHVAYCVVAAALMAALVRWAWPPGLTRKDEPEGEREEAP